MRIALLTDLFYPYQLGGAERQFYEIAKRLAKKHDVHVFTMSIKGSPAFEIKDRIHIHRFGLGHGMKKRSMISLLAFFLSFPKIAKQLNGFDLIHANQAAGIFSFMPFLKKPFILTIHDLYLSEWKNYFRFPLYYAGWVLEQLMIRGNYGRIITISSQSRKKIQKAGMKAPVSIIGNGLDTDFIKKAEAKRGNGVVFAGRLVKYKNVDILIKSMKNVQKKFPDARLVIIGSGEEKFALQRLAKELDVKTDFLGYVTEKDLIKQIKSARAFVSMSSTEGFGIVVLEAMACGTPVIIRDLECYREFCSKNNSILSDENNLETKIINVLKNKSNWKKLSENGKKTAEKFSWDSVTEKTEDVYEKT